MGKQNYTQSAQDNKATLNRPQHGNSNNVSQHRPSNRGPGSSCDKGYKIRQTQQAHLTTSVGYIKLTATTSKHRTVINSIILYIIKYTALLYQSRYKYATVSISLQII